MDNLTHSLVGAAIGQAGLKRKSGLAMPALIIGANVPDVDASCYLWLSGAEPLAFRRGITHGPIAWIVLPILVAGLLWAWDRWQTRRGTRPQARLPVHFGWLYALTLLACLTHPALDWLNSYGIRLLEPFSSRWFYGNILFIIDIWLWLLLGGAVFLSLRREKRGGKWRRPARGALALGLAYIGVNAAITAHAEDRADALVRHGYDVQPDLVVATPVPLAWWSRELLWRVEVPSRSGTAIAYGDGSFSISGGAELLDPPDAGTTRSITLDDPARARSYVRARSFLVRNDELTCWLRTDPNVAPFLFWSRMPVVEEQAGEPDRLIDQRFADPRVSSSFSVTLPRDCGEPRAGRGA
ncbi:metal-dependent hydrolase [Qipengyuania sp.]|uniref:metal-dependent hydrolase n=1 Tax=Qipengyuania sp. TaxID=2004515 RepID=UPI0035C81334